jgi:transposase-like protein
MKRRKAEFWIAHVTEMKREGISTSVYAKRHDLSVKSLYGWQRKLNVTAGTTASESVRLSFIAVHVAEPVVGQPSCECTLLLGSGMRLEMATLPSPEWLVALGRATEGVR